MNGPDIYGPLSTEEELRILLAREQTARETAERSTLYFQALFEAAPSKFVVLRAHDFQIVSVSQAYLDTAMVGREDIVGKTLFDAFPDDPAHPSAEGVRNVRASLERVKASGVTTVMALQRYPVRRPDGAFEEHYWSAVNTPVKGPAGELAFILHRVEDVTEFVRAKAAQGKEEEALQSLEERATHLELDIFLRAKEQRELAEELERERTRLVTAQRVAKVGSWEADMATRQVACSDETLRIFEVDPATFVPSFESFLALVHPDDRDKVKDAFVRSFEKRELGMLEHRLTTPDGRIKFVIERWQIFAGEGDGEPRRAIGTCQDITERLVLEEQLRQSQKMEAVGQLTGGVAHDFNNILTLILANVDAMLEDAKLAPEISRRLERISGAVQRAGELTHQLLAFSRKQTLQPQHTDFNMLVTGTEKLLRRTLGERVEIATALAADLWTTNIDRSQLEAALVNLCLNARDAMPGGGRLLIETGNVVFDEGHVARHAEASFGDHVMLSVTDGGVGMTPEVRRRVFEPFFTTKPEGEGTGLGLSMVYGFIKQSGGHIEIASQIGRGTTVRLYLPRSQTPAAANAVKEDSSLPRGSEHILVIEDEAFVRMAVVEQLGDLGYAVTEAANGMAGLALLKAGQTYDLLLTDVVMPGAVDGKGLADEAVRLQPGLRVLFMSGYPAGVTSPRGILDPDVTLLSKPFRMTELARAVRDMIDR